MAIIFCKTQLFILDEHVFFLQLNNVNTSDHSENKQDHKTESFL